MDYLQYQTQTHYILLHTFDVLNLIINGLPSILYSMVIKGSFIVEVLNLIINGLPSIPLPKG